MLKLLPNENPGETIRLRKDAVIYLLNQTVHPEGEVTKVHEPEFFELPSWGNQEWWQEAKIGIDSMGRTDWKCFGTCPMLFQITQHGNGDRTTLLSHQNQKAPATHWSVFEALAKVLTSLNIITAKKL